MVSDDRYTLKKQAAEHMPCRRGAILIIRGHQKSVCDDLLGILVKDVELIKAEADLDSIADLSL